MAGNKGRGGKLFLIYQGYEKRHAECWSQLKQNSLCSQNQRSIGTSLVTLTKAARVTVMLIRSRLLNQIRNTFVITLSHACNTFWTHCFKEKRKEKQHNDYNSEGFYLFVKKNWSSLSILFVLIKSYWYFIKKRRLWSIIKLCLKCLMWRETHSNTHMCEADSMWISLGQILRQMWVQFPDFERCLNNKVLYCSQFMLLKIWVILQDEIQMIRNYLFHQSILRSINSANQTKDSNGWIFHLHRCL